MPSFDLRNPDVIRARVIDAIDGILATAGMVEGFSGAGVSAPVLLSATMAAAVAGSIALATATYGEASSERDTQTRIIAEERRRLEMSPQDELDELTSLYEAKGLPSDLARTVAEHLTANDALAAQLDAEYNIRELTAVSPWRSAVSAAMAFLIGATLPLLVVLVMPPELESLTTGVAAITALVVLAVVTARMSDTPLIPTVLRTLLIGVTALGASFLIGTLLPIQNDAGAIP